MRVIFFLLFLLGCYSCKDLSKENSNTFKIIIDLKISENDMFELFYTKCLNEGFNNNNKITKNITKSENFQKIEFSLPKGVLPSKFRIDLGDNSRKFEDLIEIKSIKLAYNGNEIKINESLIDIFFRPNNYLQKTSRGYSRIVVNGKYDPFIESTPLLNKKIEIEF